jgi:cellulose synthase/poly-beta-1,6-N-acetylglucosamine synthase-like glycosyltransferase
VTEGPDRVRSLISQRERWQRVIMETVIHYRRMALNPRYGTVGMFGVPFFVLTEVVAPFFELASLLVVVAGFVTGTFAPATALCVLLSITFVNGILATLAIGLEDKTSRVYRRRDLLRLLLLGAVDLFMYRPVIVYARAKGTWRFLRRDTGWHKFERNARPVGA